MMPPLLALLGFEALTASAVVWVIVLFVVAFVGSIVVTGLLLVQLPATYFVDDHARGWWGDRHPALRWLLVIAKNVVGYLLIVVGIVMLFTPGQGVLTVLIGVMLIDFPGKRHLEKRLIARPKILHAINHLRARYGKPPFVLDEQPPPRTEA